MSMNSVEPTIKNGCGAAPTSSNPISRERWSSCPRAARTRPSGVNSTCRHANSSVGGFELAEAKSQVAWADPDTVLVGTDFGADSLTESGYPRVIKRWRRGTPLADAETVFEVERSDVRAFVSVDRTPGFERTVVGRAIDFWNDELYELRGSELTRIDAPTDASVSLHREWILIELRTDWTVGWRHLHRGLAAGRQS